MPAMPANLCWILYGIQMRVIETSAPELDTLPMIVVVIDEFADMMMIVGKKMTN